MRRIFVGATIAFCGVGALAPSASSAGTTVGQTGTPDQCATGYGQVQFSTGGPPTWNIPIDGTITSFSAPSLGIGEHTVLLLLRQVSGETYNVVAKSTPITFTTASSVETFPVQIPAQAGEVIGNYGGVCSLATGSSSDQFYAYFGAEPATGANQDFGSPAGANRRTDLSANLEPNPTPPAGPTGQRAAALKKCKKKHSALARRKCRKKAKLLPV